MHEFLLPEACNVLADVSRQSWMIVEMDGSQKHLIMQCEVRCSIQAALHVLRF